MKLKHALCGLITGLLLLTAGISSSFGQSPAPLVQLKAADYNPATGTWTDTSGLNNNATQTIDHLAWWPSLETNVTANGSSVVRFDGDDRLDLTHLIHASAPADGFTFFVYTRPTAAGLVGVRNLISGQVSSPHYFLNDGKPKINRQLNIAIGSADTALSSVDFNSINVKVNNAAASFRLDGAPDGVTGGGAFSNDIYYIGANFRGDIAEIRIYNSQLTAAEIAAVEAELNTAYGLPLDSDGDGLTDDEEVNTHNTDPLNPDSDEDGLSDGDEVYTYLTDPASSDSDGDGIDDGFEVACGLDPTMPTVIGDVLEESMRLLADDIIDFIPVGQIDAPNDKAAAGRRTALSNKVRAAANMIAAGNLAGAREKLSGDITDKVNDWVFDPDKSGVLFEVNCLIALIEFELGD